MWADDVRAYVEETFSVLSCCFDTRPNRDGIRSDWSFMHTGKPSDLGIRTRRVGSDPEKVKAKNERTNARRRKFGRKLTPEQRAQAQVRWHRHHAKKVRTIASNCLVSDHEVDVK
jgi:hypothetical protein